MSEQQTERKEERQPAVFQIDVDEAEARGRSLPMLIASKRCYICQSADDETPTPDSDTGPYIERIVEHCADTSDYLLADTPLKEALFRAILARGNKPTSSENLNMTLAQRWATTPDPRDISKDVIESILDGAGAYCIVRLPSEND